jgi:hypothetical protein
VRSRCAVGIAVGVGVAVEIEVEVSRTTTSPLRHPGTLASRGSRAPSTSHHVGEDPSSLAIAHRGVVLESGRMVLAGTGAELLAHERVRQAYLGL